MKRISILASLAPLALCALVFGAGCGGTVGEGTQAPQAQGLAQPETAAASPRRPGRGMKSPLESVQQAVSTLQLRADQKTQIDQLFADAKASHEKAKQDGQAARKDLFTALAAQVEAGKVDRAALEPKIAAAGAVHTQARTADGVALEKLHAILDSSQRNALVDALEKEHAGHEHGPRGDHGFAGEEHEHDQGQAHARGERGERGHGSFFKDLNLSEDQKAKIHDAMKADWDQKKQAFEMNKNGKGFHEGIKKALESFRGDTFSASAFAPPAGAPMMHDRAGGLVHFFEIATPILTPEQRTAAAADLRAK